jgi:hypothetical protein
MAVAVLTEEETFWRKNPAPEFTVGGDTLTLWNYPVARTDLSAGHKAAIDRFLAIELIGRRPLEVVLTIRGHASPTGERAANSDLALRRAQGVRTYLMSLGADKNLVTLSSAGGTEPLDGDRSGLALARDRRVVVVKFHPTAPTPEPKKGDVGPFLGDPPKQPPARPDEVIKGVGAEYKMELGPAPIAKSPFLIDVGVTGVFKVSAKNASKDGVIPGLELKNGKFSGKVEKELLDGVIGKFTIEPPKGDASMPTVKVGTQFKGLMGEPEIGAQKPPKFFYVKFTIADTPLWTDPQDHNTKISFKGDIKFDIGPGAEMVKRLADLEASLGGTTAAEGFTAAELEAAGIGGGGLAGATVAIGGAIAVVVVINGGIIYLVQNAKDEADLYTALLAQRDGKGSRVAWAIIGEKAEQNFIERESQWARAVARAQMLDAFRQGRRDVEAFLKVDDSRDKKVAEWKAKYAADATTDFAVIRERVYVDLGGTDKDPNAGASL